MQHRRNRNNDMYLQDWYDNYLMEYVTIIESPKLSQQKHRKYNEKLLEWYENWKGYMEEVVS